MYKDYSFGIIPLRKSGDSWQVFLIKHNSGHWSFPKGHQEKNESAKEAATRELQEETGLLVKDFFQAPPLLEHYQFYRGSDKIEKVVTYFIAEVEGEIKLQQKEISDGKWVAMQNARDTVTFAEAKNICTKLTLYIGLK